MTKMTVVLILTTALAAQAEQLRVTVYDRANLTQDMKQRVVQDLRFIFQHSEIAIDFAAGALDADEATLVTYANVVSKEQERRLACQARRDIAIAIVPVAPSGTPQNVLGRAFPLAAAGLNVQVYSAHIAAAAFVHNIPAADLMAHAIVHEIGHVLLRSTIHTGSGLMAGVWNSREFGWITKGSMFFTPTQAISIREAIKGLGCPATVARNN